MVIGAGHRDERRGRSVKLGPQGKVFIPPPIKTSWKRASQNRQKLYPNISNKLKEIEKIIEDIKE